MKFVCLFFTALFFSTFLCAQNTNPNYDAALAKKLGADAYGMKPYVLVLLTSGSNPDKKSAIRDSCFAGHMKNMDRWVAQKKLIVAGPIEKNSNDYRGIFILDIPTVEEAKNLLESDPAIKAKYLKPEIYTWYGSAALPVYLETADKIWKGNH